MKGNGSNASAMVRALEGSQDADWYDDKDEDEDSWSDGDEDQPQETLEEYKSRRKLKASLSFVIQPARQAGEGDDESMLTAVQNKEDYVVLSGNKSDPKHMEELQNWTERVHAGMQHEKLFKQMDGVTSFDFQPAATAQLMSWVRLKAGAGNFAARFSHTATVVHVKGVRPVMVVLGGANDDRKCVPLQVCKYDPEENIWRTVPAKGTAPVSRTGHTACLDESGDRLIMVGGMSAFGERLDTVDVLHGLREMKDLHWNEHHEAQFRVPSGQKDYPALMTITDWCGCDPHYDEIIWGRGADMPKTLQSEFYSGHWARYALRSDSQALPRISHHSCVTRASMIFIFGGSINQGAPTNDVWSLNLHNFGHEPRPQVTRMQVVPDAKDRRHSIRTTLQGTRVAFTWLKLATRGDIPPPRSSHTATMIDQNRMLVVGGVVDDPRDASNVYVLDLNSLVWERRLVHGLPALAYHTANVIGRTGRVLLFGGFVEGTAVNNVHVLDTNNWTVVEVNVQGDIPRSRGSHTASILGDRLVVSSGWSSAGELQDENYVMNHPFDSSGYASSLGSDLLAAFDKEEFSDVSFVVEGKTIHCHKIILACRSAEMRQLFTSPNSPDVIDIGERHRYPVFRAMLMYLYCDRVVLSRDMAKELMEVATLYGLEQLHAIAENCFTHVVIPPSSLNSDLGWAVMNRALSDLTCSVEGTDIPCHRVIVSNRSSYFRAMLTSGLREQQEGRVVLQDIDRQIFDAVLKFIYTDSLESDAQLAFDLFCQSSIFRIASLQDRTEQTLLSLVDDDNVVPLLEASDVYSSKLLRDRCMLYVHRFHHNLSAAGVLSQLSARLQDEIEESRRSRGLFTSQQPRAEARQDAYVDMEGSVCPKCSRPFVFVRKEWPADAPTPKDQLHRYVRGLQVEFVDKFLDNQAGGHLAGVIFKGTEYFVPRPFGNKQDAYQNAALVCLHALQCGVLARPK